MTEEEKDKSQLTGKERSLANLKPPFSKENQPSVYKGGRKPSSIKKFIKDNNLRSDDIEKLTRYMMGLSLDQIKDIAVGKSSSSEKAAIIVRMFAMAFLKDFKRGSLAAMNTALDRAFGKQETPVKLNGNLKTENTNINVDDLDPEEARKLFFDKLSEIEEEN